MLHLLFKPRWCFGWGSSRAVVVSLLVGVAPAFAQKVPDVPLRQRIMPLTQAQAEQIMREMWAAPQFSPATSMSLNSVDGQCTSVDLYPLLSNVPSQRNQGHCGNCWAWGCTGTMEIALNVQNGIRDRLSVQFINSCNPYKSCCDAGGFASFCDFYRYEGFAIPWSNPSANWSSGGGSCIPCGSIATNPRYPISSIGYHTITTKGVGQAAAIANIKAALCASNGLYFYFNVPNQADWDTFDNFFFNETENDLWNNAFCNHTWDANGGGHVVLCVGFVDDGGANRYWVMLNSWGAWGSTPANGRPTGKYRISMDIDYNCSPGLGFQAIDVAFNLPPPFTCQPISTTNCQGSTATFSVCIAPGTPLTYQWQKNGTNLSNGGNTSGATSPGLTLSNLSTNDAGTYRVVLNYGAGTTNSAPATLTVGVPPAIEGQPQSQSVCEGSTVVLCVTASGTALTYRWQLNGTNTSATQSCCILGNVHANKAGDYRCIISNACGVVTSAVATVIVTLPPAIEVQPQSQVITQGGSAAFCVTAAEGTFPSYRWQLNGSPLSGSSSCYFLSNVRTTKAGAYTAILSNACGSLTSSIAWLTVVTPLSDQTATQGAAVTLSVPICGGDPRLGCQWQRNGANLSDGGNVSGASSSALMLIPAAATDAASYTVLVGNGVGSPVKVGANLSLVVPPPPRFDGITRLANGSMQLWMSGTPGCFYRLECSSNWLEWGTLCTTSSADGCLQYNDFCPAYSRSQLFYRLKLAP